MFKQVGIPAAERRVTDYPHNMSGGMRQRVMIAMALSCDPDLLIADEPTTALDVTIQAQILELMKKLREQFNSGIMIITHDLGVVAEMADEVAVMYMGKVVEFGGVVPVLKNAKDPYTQGLLNSISSLGKKNERLNIIAGAVPNPLNSSARLLIRAALPLRHGSVSPPGAAAQRDGREAQRSVLALLRSLVGAVAYVMLAGPNCLHGRSSSDR